jgi:hypothetical protein
MTDPVNPLEGAFEQIPSLVEGGRIYIDADLLPAIAMGVANAAAIGYRTKEFCNDDFIKGAAWVVGVIDMAYEEVMMSNAAKLVPDDLEGLV